MSKKFTPEILNKIYTFPLIVSFFLHVLKDVMHGEFLNVGNMPILLAFRHFERDMPKTDWCIRHGG